MKLQSMLQTELSYADFLKLFRNIKIITNYVKLRSFQYRMLCNAIVTNKLLYKWKIIESENCTFCKKRARNDTTLVLPMQQN